jgi:hypothetical protein
MATNEPTTTGGPPPDWDPTKDSIFADQLDGGANSGDIGAQLRSVQTAMVGDPPAMDLPSDGRVMLDRGLSFEGEWHREAYLRETTGADEEALARFDLSKPGAAFLYWDTLLGRTVIQIGTVSFEDMTVSQRQEKLRSLLLGDRETLFFGLIRATWGDVRTIEKVACPRCGEESDQNIVLGDKVKANGEVLDCDFTFKHLDEPERLWYEVALRRGNTVELRLPTGEDLLGVATSWKTEPTTVENNTLMLGRLLAKHDGEPISDPMKFAKNLGTPDRQTLIDYIIEEQPGPRLGGVTTSCASCNEEFWLQLGLARLLQLAI